MRLNMSQFFHIQSFEGIRRFDKLIFDCIAAYEYVRKNVSAHLRNSDLSVELVGSVHLELAVKIEGHFNDEVLQRLPQRFDKPQINNGSVKGGRYARIYASVGDEVSFKGISKAKVSQRKGKVEDAVRVLDTPENRQLAADFAAGKYVESIAETVNLQNGVIDHDLSEFLKDTRVYNDLPCKQVQEMTAEKIEDIDAQIRALKKRRTELKETLKQVVAKEVVKVLTPMVEEYPLYGNAINQAAEIISQPYAETTFHLV